MKILGRHTLLPDETEVFDCPNCSCRFECTHSECEVFPYQQETKEWWRAKCPECGKLAQIEKNW